jgi:ABC-type lipoprotein export system ATPase subunit
MGAGQRARHVQADILKEDQGQNTCIFCTEFSLKVMGDIAEFFVHHDVRNFYSVSISATTSPKPAPTRSASWPSRCPTASPSSKRTGAAACTSTTSRPNLSFFFSNGMDPEYTVMGRVARRIWAVAMRDRYGASERSQKLKYHVQTSGRSLHAQENPFKRHPHHAAGADRDLRQLQLAAHNAYDEAITTPTEDRCGRAMADPADHQPRVGPGQERGTRARRFIRRRADRAGRGSRAGRVREIASAAACSVAMETGYQRGRIQDESMHYEMQKHTGELPIVGVNTFRNPHGDPVADKLELARSTEEEKKASCAASPTSISAMPRRRRPVAAVAGRGDRQCQRLRGVDGCRARLLAGADHPRAIRSRRALQTQHVGPAPQNYLGSFPLPQCSMAPYYSPLCKGPRGPRTHASTGTGQERYLADEFILETQGLTKEFKGFVAVSQVDLKVRRGHIHALIGPNGAGKTTFFNLLTKFLPPTAGTILYNGVDITHEKPAQTARRGIVRSFQISAVFPHMTVLENVRGALQRNLGTSFHFWRPESSLHHLHERARELLAMVDLQAFADELTVNLPYGRKRALELATTMALEPN